MKNLLLDGEARTKWLFLALNPEGFAASPRSLSHLLSASGELYLSCIFNLYFDFTDNFYPTSPGKETNLNKVKIDSVCREHINHY